MPVKTLLALVAVPVVLAAGCGGGDGAADCQNPTPTNEVVMKDFTFGPSCVEVPAGSELTIRNEGPAQHNFTVTDTDIAPQLDDDEETTIALSGLERGDYEVVCTLHSGMEGALRIT